METSLLIIETALFAVAFFFTIISSIILLSSRDGRSPANRFLVYFLLTMSISMFMNFMILGKFIVHVPWLYRLPSPLFYFLMPAAYIYVRMVLLDELRARKTDWLHAIPALLHLVEMVPYYLSANESKLAHIMEDSANPLGLMVNTEGWLPGYMHNLIRGWQGVIYALLIILMLWRSRQKRPSGKQFFPKMVQWLWVLSGMILVLSMSFVLTFSSDSNSREGKAAFLYILLAGTQIVSGLYLLLNPSILFGMPRLEKMVARLYLLRSEMLFDPIKPDREVTTHQKEVVSALSDKMDILSGSRTEGKADIVESNEPEPITPNEEIAEVKRISLIQYNEYIQLLAQLMEDKKPFLQKRYSISNLAADVKIPQHHISYLLNNIYQIRFNEYINQFRIQYIRDRLAHEDLSHLTLEGLALEAGFSSRITFIRVVQKIKGMNPSEYFKSEMA
jgi:AraC-like DNA-binding protein